MLIFIRCSITSLWLLPMDSPIRLDFSGFGRSKRRPAMPKCSDLMAMPECSDLMAMPE